MFDVEKNEDNNTNALLYGKIQLKLFSPRIKPIKLTVCVQPFHQIVNK